MFVDKHTETIEYENFLRKIQTSLVNNSRRMWNLLGIVFIWSQAQSKIFKSALVYLYTCV